MARDLSVGLFSVALCSGVACAQATSGYDAESPNEAEQSNYNETEENTGFQLFQHGIWPRENAFRRQSTTLPNKDMGLPDAQKSSKYRLSQSAAARRSAYLPSIRAAERKHALPFGLLDALIWQESRYNPRAISPAGAGGLTQLMPGTAFELGVHNRFDPAANIDGGARYLRQMLDQFGGVHLALAAYNAGPGAVQRAKGIPNNRETPGYVRKVLARWTESSR
ncbi:MAG: lytic transglycosylase domain-containing protein [Parasphingorhabdus sp.]